jgi:hypothetical protein
VFYRLPVSGRRFRTLLIIQGAHALLLRKLLVRFLFAQDIQHFCTPPFSPENLLP